MNIREIEISSWSEIATMEPDTGVYRGHSNASWELETSIRRSKLKYYKHSDGHDILFAERASLKTFKSRAHFYLDDLPENSDFVSWLSLMQHHGTPTRLLDFTHSIYVSLYFAATEATTDFCIWEISDFWLRGEGTAFSLKYDCDSRNGLRYGELQSIMKAANKALSHNAFGGDEDDFNDQGVLYIELEKQNPRLAIQQGCFLMPVTLGDSFLDNMKSFNFREYPVVTKYIFESKMRDEVLRHLRSMNITAETLFPGIDGFARSLIYNEML